MYFIELDGDQRRIQIDLIEVYKAFCDASKDIRRYQGGMRWKSTNGQEYLFKTSGGRGYGKSLGVRSKETEGIFEAFHFNKMRAKQRHNSLKAELARLSKIAVAHGIGRVPKIAADIVRSLDVYGGLGKGLSVVGTNALYAYEAAAGVMIGSKLMATMDIDLLYDSRRKIKLQGDIDHVGLIEVAKSADKTFQVAIDGGYRAINDKGYMVELVKPIPNPPWQSSQDKIGHENDLTAIGVDGFNWMINAPAFVQHAIATNGIPVKIVAPDPRVFSLMKLWLSREGSRDRFKRPRDLAQSKAAAIIAINYLGKSFDDDSVRCLPESIQSLRTEVEAFAKEHRKLDEDIISESINMGWMNNSNH